MEVHGQAIEGQLGAVELIGNNGAGIAGRRLATRADIRHRRLEFSDIRAIKFGPHPRQRLADPLQVEFAVNA